MTPLGVFRLKKGRQREVVKARYHPSDCELHTEGTYQLHPADLTVFHLPWQDPFPLVQMYLDAIIIIFCWEQIINICHKTDYGVVYTEKKWLIRYGCQGLLDKSFLYVMLCCQVKYRKDLMASFNPLKV